MVPPDEMVFGDVQYREPVRVPRPDGDPRNAWIACGAPASSDLPIFLDHSPADAIERHALSDRSVELGGILLGKECVDPHSGEPFVWITQALEARHYENTSASFTYTHESWEEISRERERRFPDLDIVGWYHTHPDFGIFLSGHDEFIQRHFFSQPLQVAYVVDPVRNTRGFFRWREGKLAPVGGFLLIGERRERMTLARLANHLENLPGGDGPTGLPPRLEAELIDMIKRPLAPSVIERPASGGTLLALLGLLLGGVLASLLFWLNGVGSELREQSRSLRRLAETPAAAAPGQVEVEAKRKVLDALLAEVRVGEPPEVLGPRLARILDAIEAERRRDARLGIENEALAALAEQQKAESLRLASELAQERQKSEAIREKARRDAEQLALLRGAGDAEIGPSLSQQAAISSQWLTWVAVAGWAAFLGSLMILLQRWLADRRDALESTARGNPSITLANPAPTHVIE